MRLVWPAREYLDSYKAALGRGWSPDNIRGRAATEEQLEEFTPPSLGSQRGFRYRITLS